jgi:spermidine synthase
VLYGLVGLIGALVGLEIPLLLRILKDRVEFKDLVSQVLTMDYLGALGASIAFPLFLVPKLGLLNTGFFFGLANVAVALAAIRLFRDELRREAGLRTFCLTSGLILLVGACYSTQILGFAEANLYADEVILARSSPFQRIVLTRWKDDLRLFLNGNLQFSSLDEYRYHESLVHAGLAAAREPRNVLILGGGDGLAAREVLRDPRVKTVTLVDLDPEMTKLFSKNETLARLNGGSLTSPRLKVINDDAFTWLEKSDRRFDFAVVDFPDPSNYSVAKLFTTTFYSLLRRRLSPGGMIAVQATSPLFAKKSYWCIVNTVAAAGFKALPYHVYVPSFGEWGFVLGATAPYAPPERLPAGLRYLDPETVRGLFEFPPDMARVEAPVNKLNTQVLVQLYESEWSHIAR